jgi:6-phosphogluconolactonase
MRNKILAGSVVALLLATFSFSGMASAAPGAGNVYTIDNSAAGNSVLQYQVGHDGTLTLAGTFSTGGTGTGAALGSQSAVVLTQDGHWLLAADAGSNQVTVFRVNNDGSLTFASITGSQGTDPISLAVNGKVVFVLDGGTPNIVGFTLGGNGQLVFIPGTIEPLSGAVSSSPEQIGFDKGNVLVVTEKAAGVIDTYTVGHDGVESAPTVTPSDGAGPYGFATTAQGFLVVSEAAGGSASSYAVSDSGALRTVSGAIPDFGNAPCWLVVSHDGRFAYVSNAHAPSTLSVYSVSGQGTLALTSSIAAKTAAPSLDLALSGNGQFLYALNGGQITAFQTYPDGGIAQVSTIGGVPASAAGLTAS